MRALSRWWDLGIALAVAVIIAIVALTPSDLTQWLTTAAALVLLVAGWLLAGRAATEGDARSVVFSIVLVVVAGALVAVHPILAIVQTLAYPLVWMLARTVRVAIAFNVAVAAAVAVGFTISTGTSPSDLASTAL